METATDAQADRSIAVVDISPYFRGDSASKQRVATQVDQACRDVGFLIVVGHGVDPELIAKARQIARAFYDCPVDDKLALTMDPGVFRGYTSPGDLSVAASYGLEGPPDHKETFAIGPVDPPADEAYREAGGAFFAENRWPRTPETMRSVWSEYYRAMEALARDLMRIFALALDMPEQWFDDKIDRHISPMSAQYYPPVDSTLVSGQLRAGPHTDFGSLTILHRDDSPGGLEVFVDDAWLPAPHVENSLTVNLGDLMSDWTNDRWKSTLHRVVLPPPGSPSGSERLAIVFFHQPNFDAVIETIPSCRAEDGSSTYTTTTSGEHFARKLAAMRGE